MKDTVSLVFQNIFQLMMEGVFIFINLFRSHSYPKPHHCQCVIDGFCGQLATIPATDKGIFRQSYKLFQCYNIEILACIQYSYLYVLVKVDKPYRGIQVYFLNGYICHNWD